MNCIENDTSKQLECHFCFIKKDKKDCIHQEIVIAVFFEIGNRISA